MATSYIFVPGKIMWAKGLADLDKEYNHYSATLKVSEDEKKRLEGAGCQATFKPADNGLFSFKIKSSGTRMIKDNETGQLKEVSTSPPEVFLTSPDNKRVDLDPKTVGNDSSVTVKLELYDTRKGGKGTRLKVVRVDEYIEFKPDNVIGGEDMPF